MESIRPPGRRALGAALFALAVAGWGCARAASQPNAADLIAEGGAALATRRDADLLLAVERFESATAIEPTNAVAWSGLADASALLGLYSVVPPAETMPRAARAAERALELDPTLARAHASLGLARYLYDWRFDEAEDHFRAALELDPANATVHHWYAMLLTALGRSDDAVAQAEAAVAAGPDVRVVQIKAATVFTAAGRYERAERQLASCLERFPDAALAHRELGYLRLREGRLEEAIPAFERARELDGGESSTLAGLGLALALTGRPQEARVLVEELESSGPGAAFDLALVHAGLDEPDPAFERLEAAWAAHDPALVYLESKPGLDRLTTDPRYAELASRIGLLPPGDP